MAKIRPPICVRFQPRFHHKLTTIYHQKTTFCITKFAKTPAKTHFPHPKLIKKKTPKPFCGSGAIGLQTARKPKFCLDDHSSTRRITAAL